MRVVSGDHCQRRQSESAFDGSELDHVTGGSDPVRRLTGDTRRNLRDDCGPPSLSDVQPTIIGGRPKRAFDLVISISAIILLIPLLLFIAAAIKLSDGGPVFFRHRRIGRNGIEFHCLKFRTMATDADATLRAHLAQNSEAAREWDHKRKLRDDPRITPLGISLRKTSVDELPQLLNILRGEMSIVGPRPIVAAELPKYGECMKQYAQARPGLTGLWQVSGRNDTDYSYRVRLDCQYVEEWSFWQDLIIISKTFRVVLTARGCY